MSKRLSYATSLILLLSIIYVHGIKNTASMFYMVIKFLNSIVVALCNISVLTYIFKYGITYSIVGIIFTLIGSPREKEGHIIGKVLYFIVGYFIAFLLDYLADILF